MAKYVKTGDLQTGTVYEFEVTYDSYVYKASAQFPAQWVWTLTFLSATGKDVNGDDVPMAGPQTKTGAVMAGDVINWCGSEKWHESALRLNLNKGATIRLAPIKPEGTNLTFAEIQLVANGEQYPVNGNCKTFDGVTDNRPIPCDDPVWVAMQANGQAPVQAETSPQQTTEPVAQTPASNGNASNGNAPNGNAPPVTGEVNRVDNDAACLVQAFATVDQAINHPLVQGILAERGYAISPEEYFTFVRGINVGLERAQSKFLVQSDEFTFPVTLVNELTEDDTSFDPTEFETPREAVPQN